MDYKELQSRRDFFKKSLHTVLPIIGTIVLGPSLLTSCSKEDDDYSGGNGGSSGGCSTCSGGCGASCASKCRAAAKYTPAGCHGSCKNACTSCRSLCYGSSK